MRINLRIDEKYPQHVRFTVFIDGRNCGQLCTSPKELTGLAILLASGATLEIEYENEWHSVEVNGKGVYETSCPLWKDDWSE